MDPVLASTDGHHKSDCQFLACFIDWLLIDSHEFLVSLGLDSSGDLRVLHVNQCAFNDFQAVHQHIDFLAWEGLAHKHPILAVINGSSCLRHIVPGILGDGVVLQRCQLRCLEEIIQSIPAESADEFKSPFQEIFDLTYVSGQAKVHDWTEKIQERFPAVAANFIENTEELMTTGRMELPMSLRVSLSTTSMIWQQPPDVFQGIQKIFGAEDGDSLAELTVLLEKRMRDMSPIVGFEDLWLLEPALRVEAQSTITKDLDFEALLTDEAPEPSHSSSRRRHKRWEVDGVSGYVQHTIEAEILNIGMTGLACQTEMPLAIGGLHNIKLHHEGGDVTLQGKVAWCRLTSRKKEDGSRSIAYQTGIEFEDTLSPMGKEVRFFFDGLAKIDVNRRIFGRFQLEEEKEPDARVEMGALVPFKVLKISFSGMQIQTASLPDEERIHLEIQFGNEKMAVWGRVACVEEVEDPMGKLKVGIEFEEMEEEARSVLKTLIRKVILD